jgi:dTDP-4-dehydrorhamnose reductase
MVSWAIMIGHSVFPGRTNREVGNLMRVLVTGSRGFLGQQIVKNMPTEWQVVEIARSGTGGADKYVIDFADIDQIKELFEHTRPDAVIHTAAMVDINRCETDPTTASRINVDASVEIATHCARLAIPCVFTSTDLVFDGHQAPYEELDQVSPVNAYGRQKLEAEEGMRSANESVIICRLCPMYAALDGDETGGFVAPMAKALFDGDTINAFEDEFRTPILVNDVADFLIELVTLSTSSSLGIDQQLLHLGGPDRLSRSQIAILITDYTGCSQKQVRINRQKHVVMPAARPSDVSLSSQKAVALGFRMTSMHNVFGIRA